MNVEGDASDHRKGRSAFGPSRSIHFILPSVGASGPVLRFQSYTLSVPFRPSRSPAIKTIRPCLLVLLSRQPMSGNGEVLSVSSSPLTGLLGGSHVIQSVAPIPDRYMVGRKGGHPQRQFFSSFPRQTVVNSRVLRCRRPDKSTHSTENAAHRRDVVAAREPQRRAGHILAKGHAPSQFCGA